ncbi:MAG: DNA primase [Candidatus Pacebacteria bacterium]|nr:DNA primase [Candidatus Paceibacterota bacterium]
MSEAVQQIKDKLSIIDIISPYVELHKAGKNFKGKSPFSAEKTPSFYVSPDRGMYYCFSTSQGGDMFNFIQAMEGVDFKEALKILAEKAGVELVREDPRKRDERDHSYAALEDATAFYQKRLPEEAGAVEYLKDRGVSKETIANWRIGYAPGPPNHGWREAKEHLAALGHTNEQMLKAGLIKSADTGKEPFDVFRDRIVFPMGESSGKIVAFSGRILTPSDKAPKYVNSPETLLYKKSELLYGYDKAKTGIRNLGFSLIVEGQFDVVMCHQAGYSNTVAVSGTALTMHHVQLLERLSDKVVLALDADKAGINAMKKGAALMLERGLDVKVAEMPFGKDPADLILEDEVNFKKVIGKSVHVIEFILHVLRREVEDDRSFKLKARDEILPFILLLANRIDEEHFLKIFADSTGTTMDAARFELGRIRELKENTPLKSHATQITKSPEVIRNNKIDTDDKAYLFLLAAVQIVDEHLSLKVKAALDTVSKIHELNQPDASELARVVFTLEQQFEKLPQLAVAEEVVTKLNQLKTGLVRRHLTDNRQLLIVAETDGDDDKFSEVLKSISEFEAKLREPNYEVEAFLG